MTGVLCLRFVGVCCPDDRDSRPTAVPVKPLKTDEEAAEEEGRILDNAPQRVEGPPPNKRPSPLGPPGKNRGTYNAARVELHRP